MWQKLDLGSAAYNTWRTNFGRSLSGSAGAAGSSSAFPLPPFALDSAVPEPDSLLLLMLSVAGTLLFSPAQFCRRSVRAVF
jgi:hypothetical protein